MPRRYDNSDRGVLITPESARRIAKAIGQFEASRRNVPARPLRTAYDDGEDHRVRLGKTSAAWAKGTLADIDVYDEGTPPNETISDPVETLQDCVNKFAGVEANKWVMLAKASNDRWYVIAAECPDPPPEPT